MEMVQRMDASKIGQNDTTFHEVNNQVSYHDPECMPLSEY